MNFVVRFAVVLAAAVAVAGVRAQPRRTFNPQSDLISLHYDHAPDLDDGQSAAADRTLLESLFGHEWLAAHVVAVSGAYGRNAGQFVAASDAVMDAAWNDAGGWVAAHRDRARAVAALTDRWRRTLNAGGDVWVKEGGQSDITAAVVARIAQRDSALDLRRRIHVVQHSTWNEDQTTPEALRYTREHTDYIRIGDANKYLNIAGGDKAFVAAAVSHPVFGRIWRSAFAYYDPSVRVDFSDTGELLHLLGIGEISVGEFRHRYLEATPRASGGGFVTDRYRNLFELDPQMGEALTAWDVAPEEWGATVAREA